MLRGQALVFVLGTVVLLFAFWLSRPGAPKAAIVSTAALIVLALVVYLIWIGSKVHP